MPQDVDIIVFLALSGLVLFGASALMKELLKTALSLFLIIGSVYMFVSFSIVQMNAFTQMVQAVFSVAVVAWFVKYASSKLAPHLPTIKLLAGYLLAFIILVGFLTDNGLGDIIQLVEPEVNQLMADVTDRTINFWEQVLLIH